MAKSRIVIELDPDDYNALVVLKSILGISWKELLIAGAIWWCEMTKLEEKIEKIEEQLKKISRGMKQN